MPVMGTGTDLRRFLCPGQNILTTLTLSYYQSANKMKKKKVRFIMKEERKEGNVLFNGALNTFYLGLYGVGHKVWRKEMFYLMTILILSAVLMWPVWTSANVVFNAPPIEGLACKATDLHDAHPSLRVAFLHFSTNFDYG